jgi:hypothetical protein
MLTKELSVGQTTQSGESCGGSEIVAQAVGPRLVETTTVSLLVCDSLDACPREGVEPAGLTYWDDLLYWV